MEFGIGLQTCVEALEIGEAKLVGDRQHLAFVLFHFIETDLVDLVGGEIGRRCAADDKLVVLCSIGQR